MSAAALRLYVAANSPFSTAVRLLVGESGRDAGVDLRVIDLASGAQRSAAYLAVNPVGTVPALEAPATGFTLSESNAILRYLAGLWELESWYPAGLEARAKVDQWLDFWQAQYWRTYLIPLCNLDAPAEARPHSPEEEARARRRIVWHLDVLEAELSRRAFVAADRPTLADLAVSATLAFAREGSVLPGGFPRVETWLSGMLARPAWCRLWPEIRWLKP